MQNVKLMMDVGFPSPEAIYSSISHSALILLYNSFGPRDHLELKPSPVTNIYTRTTAHVPQCSSEPSTYWLAISILAISCGLAIAYSSSPCSSGPPSCPPPPSRTSRPSGKQKPHRKSMEDDDGNEGGYGDPEEPPPPPPPSPPTEAADPSEPEPSGFAITLLLLAYLAIAGAALKMFFPHRFASLCEHACRFLSYHNKPLVYDLPSYLGEPLVDMPVLREVQRSLIPELLVPKARISKAWAVGLVDGTPRVVEHQNQTVDPILMQDILDFVEESPEPVSESVQGVLQIEEPYLDIETDSVPIPAGRTGYESLLLALFQLLIQFGWSPGDPRPLENPEDIHNTAKPISVGDHVSNVSVGAMVPGLPMGFDDLVNETLESFFDLTQSSESPRRVAYAVETQEEFAFATAFTTEDGTSTALDGSTCFNSFGSHTSGKTPENLNDTGNHNSFLDLPIFASTSESLTDTATRQKKPATSPAPSFSLEHHSFEIGSYSNVSDLLADSPSFLHLRAHDSYCSFSGSESKEVERDCSLQLGSCSSVPNLPASSSSEHLRAVASHRSSSRNINSPDASEIQSEGDSNACQGDFSFDRDSLSDILADLPSFHRPKFVYNSYNYPQNDIKPETTKLSAPASNLVPQPLDTMSEADRSLDILELIAAIPAEFHERLIDVKQPVPPNIPRSQGPKKSQSRLVKKESNSTSASNSGSQRSAHGARMASNTSAHRRVC